MNLQLIGERIRKYRKRMRLTQQQLGKEIGVSWEMISRYERGASSPVAQLDKLADSLGVSTIDLLTDDNTSLNELPPTFALPLFTQVPQSFDFTNKVGYFYNAPEWVIQYDQGAFAIDPTIIEIRNAQISNRGPIFVSPNSKARKGDLVVLRIDNKLILDRFETSGSSIILVGLVLAQEKRFVS